MGWKKRMKKAKELHRPSLKDWECDGLYEKFPAFVANVSKSSEQFKSFMVSSQQQYQQQHLDSNQQQQHNQPQQQNHRRCRRPVPVVLDAQTLTTEDFHKNYEALGHPCIIRNIPAGYDGGTFVGPWKAMHKWTLEALQHEDNELLDCSMKCGEDDDGHSIKVELKHFLRYLQENRDDSPLYIFDSAFDEDDVACSILRDYTVPSYFKDDLFNLISESRRPPYRWFLVGPERSGTTVHIDPLATSAWNTLLYGKKRWVLFPPNVPKRVVKGKGVIAEDEDDEAIHYFMYILPRIKQNAASCKHCDDYKNFSCYEFTQNEGETVFIPNGWWHAVLNLTHTVGVTQNFCSERNFDEVWCKTRSGRKRMAAKWFCRLEERYPHLAARALQLNERDAFVMKYKPEQIKADEHRRKLQRTV